MNEEIKFKILDILYNKWFVDYINGESPETLISKIPYKKNEIFQTLEILQNDGIVERNKIGWYVITTYGIDIYEENLPPSTVSKIISERRRILEILKEEYDKDIHKYMDDKTLKSLIKIHDYPYLLGIVEYLHRKNFVKLEGTTGRTFWIKLTPIGLESLKDLTFSSVLAMKKRIYFSV